MNFLPVHLCTFFHLFISFVPFSTYTNFFLLLLIIFSQKCWNNWSAFSDSVSGTFLYYSVTKNYFENLVRALENGLADVDSQAAAACSKTTSSKNIGGTSKGRGGRGKGSSKTGGSS